MMKLMENKKQTAVEWLFRWFNDNQEATIQEGSKAFEQAKEMEKEQVIYSVVHGSGLKTHHLKEVLKKGEEYYNETYSDDLSDWDTTLMDGLEDEPPYISDDFQIGPDGSYEHTEEFEKNPILGGGYTCSECGQYQRTSAVCDHFNLIDVGVKHNLNMKTREEIKRMGENFATTHEDVSDKLGKYLVNACFQDGYIQCQKDMTKELYEFGKLVLDTFHSEGRTHSGKERLPRVKFDEWFNELNKQD